MARRSVTYRFHPLKDKDNGITHGDLSNYRTVTDCTVESITNTMMTVTGKPQFTINNLAFTSPMNFLTSISTDKRINVLLPAYYTKTVEQDFADMCARLSFGTTNTIAIIKNLTNLQKNQGTDGLHYCQQENPKRWKPEMSHSETWHAFNKPYLIPNYFKTARPSMYRDFRYQDYVIMKHPDHGNIHNCLNRTEGTPTSNMIGCQDVQPYEYPVYWNYATLYLHSYWQIPGQQITPATCQVPVIRTLFPTLSLFQTCKGNYRTHRIILSSLFLSTWRIYSSI